MVNGHPAPFRVELVKHAPSCHGLGSRCPPERQRRGCATSALAATTHGVQGLPQADSRITTNEFVNGEVLIQTSSASRNRAMPPCLPPTVAAPQAATVLALSGSHAVPRPLRQHACAGRSARCCHRQGQTTLSSAARQLAALIQLTLCSLIKQHGEHADIAYRPTYRCSEVPRLCETQLSAVTSS